MTVSLLFGQPHLLIVGEHSHSSGDSITYQDIFGFTKIKRGEVKNISWFFRNKFVRWGIITTIITQDYLPANGTIRINSDETGGKGR
jgi:hypothetical protein